MPIFPQSRLQRNAAQKRMRLVRSDDESAAISSQHPTYQRAIRKEIRQIERYAPPFADRSVVNLSLNEHFAPPSPEIAAALQGIDPLKLVTYDTELTSELTERLAAREGVSKENILLFPGSSSALELLFSCVASGPILFPSICWSYYTSLARQSGLPVASYDIAQGPGEFQVDEASVKQALRRTDPNLLVFINPHMPTGALARGELLVECASLARGTIVLADEAYHGFSIASESVAREVNEVPNLVVSKTFSKYFGLAGIRMGYLVASAPLIEQLGKAVSPFSVPFVSTRVALAALESEDYYREQARDIMAVKDAFAARLQSIPGVLPYRSHGNFLLVELESAEAAVRAEKDIYAAGVAVRSGKSYGMPSFLRVSVGAAKDMDRVAAALEESVARHAAH